MADKSTKRYMELQMEELQESYGIEKDDIGRVAKNDSGREEDAEIAQLYEDAAEYEAELECFEAELEVIKQSAFQEIVASLIRRFPNEAKSYAQELKAVVESGWRQLVEVEQTHPEAQLRLIQATPFSEIVQAFKDAFPDYPGDFESDVKGILVQRWETYIEIKKEHIKEETAYIKTLGLKPHYAKKIYKRYHGID